MPKVIVENPHPSDEDSTISCRCGEVYRGKHAIRLRGGELVVVVDKVCPSCGKADPVRASSGPEVFRID